MPDGPRFIVSPNREKSGLRVMDLDGRYARSGVQRDFAIDPSFLFVSECMPFGQPSRNQLTDHRHYIGVRVQHPVTVVGMLVSGGVEREKEEKSNVLAFGKSTAREPPLYRCNKMLKPGDLLLGELSYREEGKFNRWYGMALDDLQRSDWVLMRRCFEEAPSNPGFYMVSYSKEGFWEQQDAITRWPESPSQKAHRDDIKILVDLGKMERPLVRTRWANLNPR